MVLQAVDRRKKRPFVRPRRRWEFNIRIDHTKKGCGDLNWFQLAEDIVQRRVRDTVVKPRGRELFN
jgi:hypothetical protein